MCSLRGRSVFEADVRRCVVDPLDVYIVTNFAKVVVGEGKDVAGVHVIDAADVDLVPLGLKRRVFCVDRGDEIGGVGKRYACGDK